MKGLIASGWQKGIRNEQEIDKLLEFCVETGITDLFFHTVMRGTSIYPSKYMEPYDFGGLNEFGEKKHKPDFDSLQYLLDHAGGIKIHAYMTMLELGNIGYKNFPIHWIMTSCNNPFFDPTVEEVQAHLVNICKEVAANYPALTGIYLEKMRYPKRVIGKGSEDTRKEKVTKIIEDISREIKSVNPNIILSYCSNLNRNHKENVKFHELVDWEDLLARGVVDKFYPTLFRNEEVSAEFDAWLPKLDPANTAVIIGACDINLKLMKERMDKCEAIGLGYIIYSYGYFSGWGEKRTDFKAKLWQPRS